jgi:hypothetical protein
LFVLLAPVGSDTDRALLAENANGSATASVEEAADESEPEDITGTTLMHALTAPMPSESLPSPS